MQAEHTYLCRYKLAADCIRAITMRVDSAASIIPATAQADKYSVGTSDGVSVRMDMKTPLRRELDTQLYYVHVQEFHTACIAQERGSA